MFNPPPRSCTIVERDFLLFSDKQQELDLPSLRVDEGVGPELVAARGATTKKKAQGGGRVVPMSHISGVKRPLTHTNSFTGEKAPKHGVETPFEDDLGKVRLTNRVYGNVTIIFGLCVVLIILENENGL